MLLTETQLRRTIRRILMENTEHYQKLAAMLTSGIDSIPQAIDLAETLGYLEVVHQTVQDFKDFPAFGGSGKVYKYRLRPNPDFRNAILSAHSDVDATEGEFFFYKDGMIDIKYQILE